MQIKTKIKHYIYIHAIQHIIHTYSVLYVSKAKVNGVIILSTGDEVEQLEFSCTSGTCIRFYKIFSKFLKVKCTPIL